MGMEQTHRSMQTVTNEYVSFLVYNVINHNAVNSPCFDPLRSQQSRIGLQPEVKLLQAESDVPW